MQHSYYKRCVKRIIQCVCCRLNSWSILSLREPFNRGTSVDTSKGNIISLQSALWIGKRKNTAARLWNETLMDVIPCCIMDKIKWALMELHAAHWICYIPIIVSQFCLVMPCKTTPTTPIPHLVRGKGFDMYRWISSHHFPGAKHKTNQNSFSPQ
jgi:hypothetical protein